jgi:hypothetical protein
MSAELAALTSEAETLQSFHTDNVNQLDKKRGETEQLRDNIKGDAIHSASTEYLVNENAWFSVPYIPGSTRYVWYVDSVLVRSISAPADSSSVVFNYSWSKAGLFTVKMKPENECGSGTLLTLDVKITMPPSIIRGARLEGPAAVCQDSIARYMATGGFSQYEWQFPNGVQAEGNTQDSIIMLKWGSQGGTVRVRGTTKEGSLSPWRGLDVSVNVLPGNVEDTAPFIADDAVSDDIPQRAFTFMTREAANDSLAKIASEIANAQKSKDLHLAETDKLKAELSAAIDGVNGENLKELLSILGKIIVAVALALLGAIILACAYIYTILFNYRLYSFKQPGSHYWENLLLELRQKNPSQPFLGIFVILIIIAAAAIPISILLFWR